MRHGSGAPEARRVLQRGGGGTRRRGDPRGRAGCVQLSWAWLRAGVWLGSHTWVRSRFDTKPYLLRVLSSRDPSRL